MKKILIILSVLISITGFVSTLVDINVNHNHILLAGDEDFDPILG
jgi:uncharacterized protein YxeA